MKLSYTFSALALESSASAAPAATIRCQTGQNNVQAHVAKEPWIQQLYSPCVNGAASDGSDFWKRNSCVAAAIAMASDHRETPIAIWRLSQSRRRRLTSTIAFVPACGISRQNLIDLVYGRLSAAGATIWPKSGDQLLTDVIDPLFTWAAREPTIPYSRFNQWLQVAAYLDIVIEDGTDNNKYFYDQEGDAD